jgi:hypothetical protein
MGVGARWAHDLRVMKKHRLKVQEKRCKFCPIHALNRWKFRNLAKVKATFARMGLQDSDHQEYATKARLFRPGLTFLGVFH